MLTIREIKADKEGIRRFEITDTDRTEVINPEKQSKNFAGALVKVSEDGMTCTVRQSGYKVGLTEDGSEIIKECIFLPNGNSVNQLGVALSKFDAKTKDMTDKYVELEYRQSVTRSSTSAPSSSKIERFATAEEKAQLALLEEAVKGRATEAASERDIAWFKVQMKKYNAHLAECKLMGQEPTMDKPRNPESTGGSFVDRLTDAEYEQYQAIIKACDERKASAPKASRKLSDEEKADRRKKAADEAEAEFLRKYGNA